MAITARVIIVQLAGGWKKRFYFAEEGGKGDSIGFARVQLHSIWASFLFLTIDSERAPYYCAFVVVTWLHVQFKWQLVTRYNTSQLLRELSLLREYLIIHTLLHYN